MLGNKQTFWHGLFLLLSAIGYVLRDHDLMIAEDSIDLTNVKGKAILEDDFSSCCC